MYGGVVQNKVGNKFSISLEELAMKSFTFSIVTSSMWNSERSFPTDGDTANNKLRLFPL